MFETVQLLAGTNLVAARLLGADTSTSRYTLSLLSLAFFGVRRPSDEMPAGSASVSVIIPTFIRRPGRTARSRRCTGKPCGRLEIMSWMTARPMDTRAVAERARAMGLADMVVAMARAADAARQ